MRMAVDSAGESTNKIHRLFLRDGKGLLVAALLVGMSPLPSTAFFAQQTK